jgi:RNA polymerase sigma-70 factor, ECF subfamily
LLAIGRRRETTRTAVAAGPEPAVKPSEASIKTGAAPGAENVASSDTRHYAQTDEDVRLMLAFQAGDESAFTRLVERNQARIYATVSRFVGQAGSPEDLVQEVFLRVFRTAKRYKPTARFSTWLYRIAVNLSLNAIRASSKLHLVSMEGPEDSAWRQELPDEQDAGPDEALDAAEMAEAVRQAVDKLPEAQKIAIVLHRYEHLNYDQVAQVLECSTMAVKSLLSRARMNLRESLSRYLRQ